MKSKWKTLFAQHSFIENYHTQTVYMQRIRQNEMEICLLRMERIFHETLFGNPSFQVCFHSSKWQMESGPDCDKNGWKASPNTKRARESESARSER